MLWLFYHSTRVIGEVEWVFIVVMASRYALYDMLFLLIISYIGAKV